METAKKGDFVELKYTGYSNGNAFDSNIEEDLKKINSVAQPRKTIIVVGQRMVVPGLDNDIEGKEIGKEYEVVLKPKEGFGERDRNLMKTIPLSVFSEKNIDPRPGMVLNLDDSVAKVVAVSGARIITDFNNPLAGKDIIYKYKIERKVDDEKEKAEALFDTMFRFVPDYEIKEKIVIKGPQIMEAFVKAFSDKFKELMGKELEFKLAEMKEDTTKQ